MRALCGAIIAAGAMIGLGLASLGHGTRYARLYYYDKSGDPQWVRFWQMDVALIVIIVLLICTLMIGLAIAILGLAYHHQRRHLEHLHRTGAPATHDTASRMTVT